MCQGLLLKQCSGYCRCDLLIQLVGRGMLSCLLQTCHLSAILKPYVGAGQGLLLWGRGGTLAHLQAGMGADFGFA